MASLNQRRAPSAIGAPPRRTRADNLRRLSLACGGVCLVVGLILPHVARATPLVGTGMGATHNHIMARGEGQKTAGVTVPSAISPQAGVSLVRNGGFEAPVVPVGRYGLFSSGQAFAGWGVIGAVGNVAAVNGTYTENGFTFPAQEGAQWLDLTGNSNTATGVAQVLTTTPGAAYTLTFSLGNIVDPTGLFGATSTVHVLVNGAEVFSATNALGRGQTALVWQRFTTRITASAMTTTLGFLNGDPPTDNSNALDAVSLVPVQEQQPVTTPAGATAATTLTVPPTTGSSIVLATTLSAGIAGTTLPSTTQLFHLLVPATAVTATTTFSVGIVAPRVVPLALGPLGTPNNVGLGAAYSLQATATRGRGLVLQFKVPLTFQLSYDPAEVTRLGLTPRALSIAYFAPAARGSGVGTWVGLKTVIVPGTTTLSAPLTHFTLFQVRTTARTRAQFTAAQARLAALAAAPAPRVVTFPADPVVGGVPVVVTLPRGSLRQPPTTSITAAAGAQVTATFTWGTHTSTQTARLGTQAFGAIVFTPPAGFPRGSTTVHLTLIVTYRGHSRAFSGSFTLLR